MHSLLILSARSYLQHTDPNEALAVWYKLFMDVVNRHAPIRHKRVKHLATWLKKNIFQAMSDRDRLKIILFFIYRI